MRADRPFDGLNENSTIDEIVDRLLAIRPAEATSWEQRRAYMDSASLSLDARLPVDISQVEVAGLRCEQHSPQSGAAGTVIYLHGGAFTTGSAISHRHLASYLCQKSELTVYVIDYRLAPEHPFPAGRDDALACARALSEGGPIHLAGDSAGGNIALSIAAQLDTPPSSLVLLSPWLDLTCKGSTYAENAVYDRLLSPEALKLQAGLYAGEKDVSDPVLSPLHVEPLKSLPVLLQVGDKEMFIGECEALHAKWTKAGASIVLTKWEKMIHGWQLFWPMLDAGRRALDEAAVFLHQHNAKATN